MHTRAYGICARRGYNKSFRLVIPVECRFLWNTMADYSAQNQVLIIPNYVHPCAINAGLLY